MMIRYVVMVLMSVWLMGCQSTPTIITEQKVVQVGIPEGLLTVYPIAPLPNREAFINGSDAIRVKMMVEYNIELLGILAQYRNQTLLLKEYNNEVTGTRADSLREDR